MPTNPLRDPRFWEKSLAELDFRSLDPALGPDFSHILEELGPPSREEEERLGVVYVDDAPGPATTAEQLELALEYRRQHGFPVSEHYTHMLDEMRRNGRRSARRRGFMHPKERDHHDPDPFDLP